MTLILKTFTSATTCHTFAAKVVWSSFEKNDETDIGKCFGRMRSNINACLCAWL